MNNLTGSIKAPLNFYIMKPTKIYAYCLPENTWIYNHRDARKKQKEYYFEETEENINLNLCEIVPTSNIINEYPYTEEEINNFKKELTSPLNHIGVDLKTKKQFTSEITEHCILQSGKKGKAISKLQILTPTSENYSNKVILIKTKALLEMSEQIILSAERNKNIIWSYSQHHHCVKAIAMSKRIRNLIDSYYDNFLLDPTDYIILQANHNLSHTIWDAYNYFSSLTGHAWSENHPDNHILYNHKVILQNHKVIPWRVVQLTNNPSANFGESKFNNIVNLLKSPSVENYDVAMNILAHVNISTNENIIYFLLIQNYISASKKRILTDESNTKFKTFDFSNWAYYSNNSPSELIYYDIDQIIQEYEKILKCRYNERSISKSDMEIIAKYFLIPHFNASNKFSLKLTPTI